MIEPKLLISLKFSIIGDHGNSTIGSSSSPTDKDISSAGKNLCR